VTIHLYTFGWNEMRMIGFFFRHYEPFVDKFIFFDDGSTDGTPELLASKKNVEVRPFTYAFPDSFSLSVQAWRNSSGKRVAAKRIGSSSPTRTSICIIRLSPPTWRSARTRA
jgi:hypothetical protein